MAALLSDWVEERPGRGRCAVAAVPLEAGAVVGVFGGAAYACLPLPSHRERLCTHCFCAAAQAKLMRCTRCKWVRYCSGTCQKADWPSHKHECRALTDPNSLLRGLADAPAADLLLAARCLWRRHGPDATGDAADDTFDALEPGGTPSENDRALARLAASLDGLLPPVADAEGATARLLGVFTRNNFGVLGELLFVDGAGCYPNTALLNHSCAPSCVLAFDGPRVEVRTLRAVDAGDELTHCYVDLCLSTRQRRVTLRERYGFECTCPRCTDGLTTADGTDVDSLLDTVPGAGTDGQGNGGQGASEGGSTPPAAAAESLRLAAALMEEASQETDEQREHELMMRALSLRRSALHPLSALVYEAEGRALSTSLACGDLPAARESCHRCVQFLEMSLAHVPAHPLLALQRFTLADLERSCGDECAARLCMQECVSAIELTSATRSSLRGQAREVLRDLT